MNTKKYQWILYSIAITIGVTIAVQVYWNYKNYEENKRLVTNEIQLSLDNALEEYYSSLAKQDFVTILNTNKGIKLKNEKKTALDTIIRKIKEGIKSGEKPKYTINNIKITSTDNLSEAQIDSMMNQTKEFVKEFNNPKDTFINKEIKTKNFKPVMTQFTDHKNGYHITSDGKKQNIKLFRGKRAADSIRLITSLEPIFISFLEQSIEYKKIDSLIENQLESKGIDVKNSFRHLKFDTIYHQSKDSVFNTKPFLVSSKSTYAKEYETFQLAFNNPSRVALKRSLAGISISLLLSLLIIFSLFYLLKVINQQKELAAIKNDLISNITHEFKTPIATVSTAIEAIENFNVLDDKEKTQKYLSMSSVQLKKLHQMVEKLLETATLDSEKLLLKKEETDLVFLVSKLATKHQLLAKDKTINFNTNIENLTTEIDAFHFENAISNLIDNAIKYGGNQIEVSLNKVLNTIEINVADNGLGIEKNQQEKIFDKFYRVPKGNTHDVKGFGIGLYYTKKIIEKHGGEINLMTNTNQTIFKISLPNAKD